MKAPTAAETRRLEKRDLEIGISNAMASAYIKAFDSLSRYKFLMFGYWAGQWVKLNSLLPHPRPSPFRALVKYARERPDLLGDILPVQKCACPDTDARRCFEIRYPNRDPQEAGYSVEECGCPCHGNGDDDGVLVDWEPE